MIGRPEVAGRCTRGRARLAWVLMSAYPATFALATEAAPMSPEPVEISPPYSFRLPAHLYGEGAKLTELILTFLSLPETPETGPRQR